MQNTATALANPNIAFIKYWGNSDEILRIPINGSLSMNLAGLETRTTVRFDPDLEQDTLFLNGENILGEGLIRVSTFLDRVRKAAGTNTHAQVDSDNNFPTGSGIASSASAFAALALAASAAAGLNLEEAELSRLARTGSGSASRSIPGGFVEWQAGNSHDTSYAYSIAPPDHWELADCVAIVSQIHKATGSTGGHALAPTSPLQTARVLDAAQRLDLCRSALLQKDFSAFADIVEHDSNLMHAVMMTSNPALFYWDPPTLAVMQAVRQWRKDGLQVCYTIDAGPNVHLLCPQSVQPEVEENLMKIPGVQKVISALPGGPAKLIDSS